MNSGSLQRIGAYLLDLIIIGLIASLLTFWIPESDKYKEAYETQKEQSDLLMNNEIGTQEYFDTTMRSRYVMEKETVIQTVVGIVIAIGYFGTFAYYKNGQTIGKKLMKIKVVNNEGKEPGHLQLIFRICLLRGIFTTILSTILLFVLSENEYMVIYGISIAQSIFLMVCALMMVIREDKRGLHDMIAKTKVITE